MEGQELHKMALNRCDFTSTNLNANAAYGLITVERSLENVALFRRLFHFGFWLSVKCTSGFESGSGPNGLTAVAPAPVLGHWSRYILNGTETLANAGTGQNLFTPAASATSLLWVPPLC